MKKIQRENLKVCILLHVLNVLKYSLNAGKRRLTIYTATEHLFFLQPGKQLFIVSSKIKYHALIYGLDIHRYAL